MHLIDINNKPKNSHHFFVDNSEECRQFDLCKQLNTHPSLLANPTNRLKLEQLEKIEMKPQWFDDKFISKMNKEKLKKYKELAARVKRKTSLAKLEQSYNLTNVNIIDH
jgi:hypothetical protein